MSEHRQGMAWHLSLLSLLWQVILAYYKQMIPFARNRSQAYFGFDGIHFTETATIFGAYAQVRWALVAGSSERRAVSLRRWARWPPIRLAG